MVLLTTTPRILSAVSSLSSSERSSLNKLPTSCGQPIEHSTVIALSRFAQGSSLNILLRGAYVYVPPPVPKPQPSAEYVALMDRLHKEQEQRQYAALVSKRAADQGSREEEKDDVSPSLVLNILLSVVMCAVAMFYLTRWWPNDGLRVMVSLSTGIVVGVAEVTVYAAYLRKVKISKRKERSKREKKELIGEYRGEIPEENALLSTSTGKEEIWGRGVNGGMRRRVRERWEKEQKIEES